MSNSTTIHKAVDYNKGRDYPRSVIERIQAHVGAHADGYWGPRTVAKVMIWQKSNGLTSDGMVGPVTYQKMIQEWDDVPTSRTGDSEAYRKALDYNTDLEMLPFVCPITHTTILPDTPECVEWVRHVQEAFGRKAHGKLTEGFQREFTLRYGPFRSTPATKHPAPLFVWRWGYDHAHDWDSPQWPYIDKEWESVTSGGQWEDGMVRLVSGYDRDSGRTSRPGRSWITLDHYSISFPHYYSKTAPKVVARLVKACPEDAVECFGELRAKQLEDPKFLLRNFPVKVGRSGRKKAYFDQLWFATGWWAFGSRPDVVTESKKIWLEDYVNKGVWVADQLGIRSDLKSPEIGAQVLAACTRMANSAAGLAPTWYRNSKRLARGRDTMSRLEACFSMDKEREVDSRTGRRVHVGGYGHPDRWRKITSWPEFKGVAPIT